VVLALCFTYFKYLPSGLQRGRLAAVPVDGIGMGSPPLIEIIHECVEDFSLSRLVCPTVQASLSPSGLICGLATRLISKRSSTSSGRGVCPVRGAVATHESDHE